jgi:hypothetical protein
MGLTASVAPGTAVEARGKLAAALAVGPDGLVQVLDVRGYRERLGRRGEEQSSAREKHGGSHDCEMDVFQRSVVWSVR